jgi:hypothetical protein
MEPETVDRLLLVGYGPRFIAQRWGIDRKAIAKHRDRCLVGERRAGVEADLRSMASKAEGVSADAPL